MNKVKCTRCGKMVDIKIANKQVDGTFTCDPCVDKYRRSVKGGGKG